VLGHKVIALIKALGLSVVGINLQPQLNLLAVCDVYNDHLGSAIRNSQLFAGCQEASIIVSGESWSSYTEGTSETSLDILKLSRM